MASSAERNKLRSLTVGREKKPKIVTVEWEGKQFQIRQPGVGDKIAIMEATGLEAGARGVMTMTAAGLVRGRIEAAIRCTYVPETGERLFEEADRASLFGTPDTNGSFLKVVGDAAFALAMDGEDPVELGKD